MEGRFKVLSSSIRQENPFQKLLQASHDLIIQDLPTTWPFLPAEVAREVWPFLDPILCKEGREQSGKGFAVASTEPAAVKLTVSMLFLESHCSSMVSSFK